MTGLLRVSSIQFLKFADRRNKEFNRIKKNKIAKNTLKFNNQNKSLYVRHKTRTVNSLIDFLFKISIMIE